MRNTLAFVLRKLHGRFDACLAGSGQPAAYTPGRSLRGLGFALLPVLLVLVAIGAALVALAALAGHHAPVHLAHLGVASLAIGQTATVETKQLVDEMKSAFEKFKETHAAQEAEYKKLGESTAETDTQLKKLNARLDEVEVKAQRARIRPSLDRIDDEIREERAQGRSEERKAFSKFVRRGDKRLSNDEIKMLSSLKYLDPDSAEFKDLDTDADTEGGVFVPHQLANRVIQKLILVSPFRAVANVEVISTGALEIPKEGATNFAGGWVGERGGRTKTASASLSMERIPVHEMYAEPAISQTQLDDSVFDVETWLTNRVSTILSQIEGLAFIKGSGVTQPEGIAGNTQIPAGQQLTIANGTFSANTTAQGADQLITMWATLPTFYANEATWVLNRATLGIIRKFKDNNNQYLWAPGGFGDGNRGGFPATIMGQPYVEMPDMDSIGAGKFPLQLGNFRAGYQIVDRIGMRVIRDNLTNKPFVLFYTTKRVGGSLVLAEAVVQLKTT